MSLYPQHGKETWVTAWEDVSWQKFLILNHYYSVGALCSGITDHLKDRGSVQQGRVWSTVCHAALPTLSVLPSNPISCCFWSDAHCILYVGDTKLTSPEPHTPRFVALPWNPMKSSIPLMAVLPFSHNIVTQTTFIIKGEAFSIWSPQDSMTSYKQRCQTSVKTPQTHCSGCLCLYYHLHWLLELLQYMTKTYFSSGFSCCFLHLLIV